MSKLWKIITSLLLGTIIISACVPVSLPRSPTRVFETPAGTQEPDVPVMTNPPAQTEPALLSFGGSFLLLQSGMDAYSIIDFVDLSITPFDPPGPDQQYRLAENLSPSGTQILFPVSQDETMVYDFATESIQTTYRHEHNGSRHFLPDRAAASAREALPGLKYSDEALLNAVYHAFQQSISNIAWNQNDNDLLTVLPAGEISTQLVLHNLQTGTHTPLEEQPGLVEEFWVEPKGEKILLKKGFMFDAGVWQDDRYYLVGVMQGQAEPIILPENADNPLVFWFSPDKIGIIHQPALTGGEDFSVRDAVTLERVQLVSGPFTGVYPLGKHLLSLHHDPETKISLLILRSMDSQKIFKSETITGICFLNARVDDHRLLLNCEEESILLEEDLVLTPIGKPTLLFVHSPNKSLILRVTRDGQTTLLTDTLEFVKEITLEADPKEIVWLPDSSAFLYRTARHLYLYCLETGQNQHLLTSDLFGDYRNLNAVWIQSKP
jgi:hypothetical protein